MTSIRCSQCGALVPLPDDLTATRLRCGYCGADQPVPDLETRHRLALEAQREAREREERERREAIEREERERERGERERDRREQRRGRWGGRLMTLVAVLAAPVIVSITVFDLPARLGFGSSGAERLGQVAAQLVAGGCAPLVPARSVYATTAVSQLVTVEGACVRVLAAGGGGHGSLSLRLYSDKGVELAHTAETADPQLAYCPRAPGLLRYEVRVGPAAKGRLTHMALRCPP